ncbi:MAG TPA: hypothetical protein VGP82_22435 [Ktedonobacterales bacterium]|nr:hypothetical protein [Ktedonobacterales bacterium]
MTDSVDMAEVALLGRIAGGDRQALTDLYLRYRIPRFLAIWGYLGNSEWRFRGEDA